MSLLRFRLPSDLPSALRRWLPYAYLVRSSECCPVGSSVEVTSEELVFHLSDLDGPVAACIPWLVGEEVWMLSTTTLLPNQRQYDLVRELARGQLHRVRSAVADWTEAGLSLPQELHTRLREGAQALLASAKPGASTTSELAGQALYTALATGQALTLETARYLAQARQRRLPVQFYLGWCAGIPPPDDLVPLLQRVFHGLRIAVPFDPQVVHDDAFWKRLSTTLSWAEQHGWQLSLGPIFDFASERFLQHCRAFQDTTQLLDSAELFLRRAVASAAAVNDWLIAAAINFFPVADSVEAGLAFLGRLLQPVKPLLADKRVSVSFAQPYGEATARSRDQPVALLLADWLARMDWGVTALEVELVFGCEPRGGLLRPPWSISQLLDWFAELQLPLHISLGIPAAAAPDPLADPPDQDILVPASEAWQAAWTAALLDIALAHPGVHWLTWLDATDAAPHIVPHGGILDANGRPRQVLEVFRQRRPPQQT